MTSRSRRKRPTTPSSILRSILIRTGSAAAIALLGVAAVGQAADRSQSAASLQRVKPPAAGVRWNEIRERSAQEESRAVETKIEVPTPVVQKPGLPPITKTIFDQIDSPFGDPTDEELAEVEVAQETDELNQEGPIRMREFLAPGSLAESLEQSGESLADESVVGPVVPIAGAGEETLGVPFGEPAIRLAQNLPEPVPAKDALPLPLPAKEPRAVDGPEDLPELRPLRDITPYYDYYPIGSELYVAGAGTKDPQEKELPTEGSLTRVFGGTNFMWAASNVYYNPLYFEDPELERYGQDHGFLQPAASIARFGVQLVGLPYQMALDPMCQKVYPLGYYRPNEFCTPRKKSRIPFNAKAAATAAGAYTGLIFIFP